MFKSILLAYDGSNCANHAAEAAKEIACRFGAKVLVVNAFHPIPRRWGDDFAEKAVAEEIAKGNLLIGGVVDRLTQAGLEVEGLVIEGLPHDAVAKTARKRGIDLIVIGSLGMGERTSFLMGTVSDKVVHRAACPVLVVR